MSPDIHVTPFFNNLRQLKRSGRPFEVGNRESFAFLSKYGKMS
ncbi:hypothetical protein HMPREF9176_0708 [Streptococcus downei F0415]|nr:hypothetical protein HMPREF9176_0708 [Streptococcus downei F0415]